MRTDVGQSAGKPAIDPLVANYCEQFQLSPAEGAAFAKLLSGNLVSNDELFAVVSSTPGGNPKIVPVVINRLRSKLARAGIRIINRARLGYRLDRNTRMLLAIGRAEERV